MGISTADIESRIPIGHIGTKQEIGEICLFLATDMARLITSSVVVADGGSWLTDVNVKKRLEIFKAFTAKM